MEYMFRNIHIFMTTFATANVVNKSNDYLKIPV